MRSTFIAAAAIAASVSALPSSEVADLKRAIMKRQNLSVTSGVSDAVILNFALTLEHLENDFYSKALAKYTDADFVAAGYTGVYRILQDVAADEANHVSFLTAAITAAGAVPVQACTYSFPYNSVASFLALSQVIEGVGTSAYLGAAGAINGSTYVTVAGSILTVEARHNTFLRFLAGAGPTSFPYDTPQSATNVVTLVTPFFVSCPAGSAPTIAPHPALAVSGTSPTAIGQMLNVAPTNASVAASFKGTVYCGFASGLNAGFSVWNNGSCMVPTSNVTNGQTYVLLTSGPLVADMDVLAGPAIIELGATNYTIALAGAASGTAAAAAAATGTAAGAAGTGAATAKSGASILAGSSILAFIGAAVALVL